MSTFLARLHADLRRTRHTRRGATHAPHTGSKEVHKQYPRMQRVLLPQPEKFTEGFFATLVARRSSTHSGGTETLTLMDCGTLLGTLACAPNSKLRTYPSAGALYPIETYLIATRLEGYASGVYHYHPSAHALERLWDTPADFEMHQIVPKPEWLAPSALVVFTSVWARSSAKYGDFAYQHALLEAGHMSQNVLLAGTGLNLQARPIAGFHDQRVIELLDLNADYEQPVHSITVAKGTSNISASTPHEE